MTAGTAYPSLDSVATASREQLGYWRRFLPSPGMSAVGRNQKEFDAVLKAEAPVMDAICKRFEELGGMNVQISKLIGWEDPL